MTIQQSLSWATIKLQRKNIPSANLDADILLSHILNKDKVFIYSHPDHSLTQNQITKFKKIINRRLKGEPVAYLIGYKEFYKLNFYVDQHVLIPRPETELIVDQVLKQLSTYKKQSNLLIDLGTGCGNIPISIVKNSNLAALAIDISRPALNIAHKNAKLHKLNKKIKFIHANLLEPILKNKKYPQALNLIITANLPYLPQTIYQSNYKNLKYEPKSALVAKNNGLEIYIRLLKQIKTLIRRHSLTMTIYFEILPIQAKSLTKLIKQHLPLAKITIKKDLAGLNRLIVLKLFQVKTNPK